MVTLCPSVLQIDLRYADPKQGDVIVVVAPVLRFKDVGFNANVTLEDLGQSSVIFTAMKSDRGLSACAILLS
jgi:hypothetical protein